FHRERLARHPDDYLPNIRQLIEEGLACPAPTYADCLDHQRKLCFAMDAVLSGRVTVAVTPATTGPAPAADTTGNPAFNSPWSYTGLPTISLPTGQFINGLPLAIQLIGRKHREVDLFRAAARVEAMLGIGVLMPPLPY